MTKAALTNANGSLRRLDRSLREARKALILLTEARLGDVLGSYVVEPGEQVDREELRRFVSAVLAEYHGQGLEVLVVAGGEPLQSRTGREEGSHGGNGVRR